MRLQKAEAEIAACEASLSKSSQDLDQLLEPDSSFFDRYKTLAEENRKFSERLLTLKVALDEIRGICDRRIALARMRIDPPPHFSETLPVWRHLHDKMAFLKEGDSVWVQFGNSRTYVKGKVASAVSRNLLEVHKGHAYVTVGDQGKHVTWNGEEQSQIVPRLDCCSDKEVAVLSTVFADQQLEFKEDEP